MPSPVELDLDDVHDSCKLKNAEEDAASQLLAPLPCAQKIIGYNVGQEIIDSIFAVEKQTYTQIKEETARSNQRLDLMEKLIVLREEIGKFPKEGAKEIPDKMKEQLQQLKKEGIDLLEEGKQSLSKEEIHNLKDQIDARRSQLQTQNSSMMSRLNAIIQQTQAILQGGQKVITQNDRLHETISRNSNLR